MTAAEVAKLRPGDSVRLWGGEWGTVLDYRDGRWRSLDQSRTDRPGHPPTPQKRDERWIPVEISGHVNGYTMTHFEEIRRIPDNRVSCPECQALFSVTNDYLCQECRAQRTGP